MNRRPGALLFASLVAASGCASSNADKKPDSPATPEVKPADEGPKKADRGRCDPKDRRVVEVDVNKDNRADVWKFYRETVDQGTKVEVLTCKEVDLNFDNHKDMWVYYDEAGNIAREEFDLDFDGNIDLWTYRQQGKIVRQELDTNFDSKADIWKYFENEKLVRIERSSQRNDKVDVWEYYEGGKLDRIGYDTTGSGRVDKWDRAPDDEPQPSGPATPPPNPGATPAPGTTPAPDRPASGATAAPLALNRARRPARRPVPPACVPSA